MTRNRHQARDEYGRFATVYTPEEIREHDRERQRKRRAANPELVTKWNRDAKRRQRAREALLARKHVWKYACGICLQFGHKRSWCPLMGQS